MVGAGLASPAPFNPPAGTEYLPLWLLFRMSLQGRDSSWELGLGGTLGVWNAKVQPL